MSKAMISFGHTLLSAGTKWPHLLGAVLAHGAALARARGGGLDGPSVLAPVTSLGSHCCCHRIALTDCFS